MVHDDKLRELYKAFMTALDDEPRLSALGKVYSYLADEAIYSGNLSSKHMGQVDKLYNLASTPGGPYHERETAYAMVIRIFERSLTYEGPYTIDSVLPKATEARDKLTVKQKQTTDKFQFLLMQVRSLFPDLKLAWTMDAFGQGVKMGVGKLVWGVDALDDLETKAQEVGINAAAFQQLPRIMKAEALKKDDATGKWYYDGSTLLNLCVSLLNKHVPALGAVPIPPVMEFNTAPPKPQATAQASSQSSQSSYQQQSSQSSYQQQSQQTGSTGRRQRKQRTPGQTQSGVKKGKLWTLYEFVYDKLAAGASEVDGDDFMQFQLDRYGKLTTGASMITGYSQNLQSPYFEIAYKNGKFFRA